MFLYAISGSYERFQYFNFEINFLENEIFFEKLEYRFLVESTDIENASLPYKTVVLETNVKTNRPIRKNGYRPVTTFASVFIRASYKELI